MCMKGPSSFIPGKQKQMFLFIHKSAFVIFLENNYPFWNIYVVFMSFVSKHSW